MRLSVSSTSPPLCSLSSAFRCHPVFCRDLRIILILVCCLYAVLPYISHSLVAPLIYCHAPGIARGRSPRRFFFVVCSVFSPHFPLPRPVRPLVCPHRPAALGCFYLLPLLAGATLVRALSCPFCCLTAARFPSLRVAAMAHNCQNHHRSLISVPCARDVVLCPVFHTRRA